MAYINTSLLMLSLGSYNKRPPLSLLFHCTCSSHFSFRLFLSFLKVDLGRILKIRSIAMQGAKDGRGYIKSFTISTKDYAGSPWRPFKQNDKAKVGDLTCLSFLNTV